MKCGQNREEYGQASCVLYGKRNFEKRVHSSRSQVWNVERRAFRL